MSESWARGYLRQSKADFDAYILLRDHNALACHQLHYLQMCGEKLAKAALLAGGRPLDEVNGNHRTFCQLLHSLRKNQTLRRLWDMKREHAQANIDAMTPIAFAIERLAPALARTGPNAEYPWQIPTRGVVAPADYEFDATRAVGSPAGRKLLALLHTVVAHFEELFGISYDSQE